LKFSKGELEGLVPFPIGWNFGKGLPLVDFIKEANKGRKAQNWKPFSRNSWEPGKP